MYGGKGPAIVWILWCETIFSLIFVLLRVYTRARIMNRTYWDDYFAIVSWAMLMFNTLFTTIAALNGFGMRSKLLTLPEIAQANKWEIIGQTFMVIGIATSKGAVALFLVRIVVQKWQRIVLWFMVGSLLLLFGLCAIWDFARCNPVAHVWDPSIPANCWMSTEAYTAYSVAIGGVSTAVLVERAAYANRIIVYSAIIDIVLAIFPWYILWNLQMKWKDKVLICSAMSLGTFAFVCAIIKTIELRGLSARSDYTYETVPLIIWSSSEVATNIVTCSIPTLRPLYNKVFRIVSCPTENNYEFEHHNGRTLLPENEHDHELAGIYCGASGKPSNATSKHERRDDASDRSILRSTRDVNCVLRTQEIIVTVSENIGKTTMGNLATVR